MIQGQHHHRINMDKFHPGYFGKVGMRYFHKTMNQYYENIVNIDMLPSFIPEEITGPVIVDTLKLGYTKVLGNGHITRPMVVRARFVSRKAELKIVAAGGRVELIA